MLMEVPTIPRCFLVKEEWGALNKWGCQWGPWPVQMACLLVECHLCHLLIALLCLRLSLSSEDRSERQNPDTFCLSAHPRSLLSPVWVEMGPSVQPYWQGRHPLYWEIEVLGWSPTFSPCDGDPLALPGRAPLSCGRVICEQLLIA